jgi:hypothetical protein
MPAVELLLDLQLKRTKVRRFNTIERVFVEEQLQVILEEP